MPQIPITVPVDFTNIIDIFLLWAFFARYSLLKTVKGKKSRYMR